MQGRLQGERNGSVDGNGTQAGFSRCLVLMVTDYAEVRGTTVWIGGLYFSFEMKAYLEIQGNLRSHQHNPPK